MSKIAVILIRSLINMKPDVVETLNLLNLGKKNTCAIIEDTPSNRAMLQRAKDYITWGDLDDETLAKLNEKRKDKKVAHLSPPRKGYGRAGIKSPFLRGGALGNRKEKINDLIQRMIENEKRQEMH